MFLTINEILNAVNGRLLQGDSEKVITEISTDSRRINDDCLFVPIKGEKFDGHDFINDAIDKGANSVLISKHINTDEYYNKNIIYVEDTIKALHSIGKLVLNKHNIPVIAVTGSTGKTTTKELIYSVLSQKYKVLKNRGNYNNHIGLPLTLFEANNNHEIAVLEMGMSGRGEIDLLCDITKPEVGVITNIGTSHIEKLGSQEEIYNAKMEITNYMDKNSTLICNGDDNYLNRAKGIDTKFNKMFIGLNKDNDIYAQNIVGLGYSSIEFEVCMDNQIHEFKLNVTGTHNVYNALIAIVIGKLYGMEIKDIDAGLRSYKGAKMRLNVIEVEDVIIINDCYNASPDSMRSALKVLSEINSPRKLAILGDMLEMGSYSEKYHKEVGAMVHEYDINLLITVGKEAKKIGEGAMEKGFNKNKILSFNNNNEVINYLKNVLRLEDSLLIKGSRGMKMEEIVQFLQERG